MAANFVFGVGTSANRVTFTTLFQLHAAPEVRGRVYSTSAYLGRLVLPLWVLAAGAGSWPWGPILAHLQEFGYLMANPTHDCASPPFWCIGRQLVVNLPRHSWKKEKRLMPERREARYCSKIIKAGALLADTKTLLANWNEQADIHHNLARAQRENVFGKASRSRVEDILAIFRQRYLLDPDVLAGLVHLVKAGWASERVDRILYFLAAKSDGLLYDAVAEVVAPRAAAGYRDVATGDIQAWVLEKVGRGMTEGSWSGQTAERVAQGLLATLRDFGILEGAVKKRIAPVFLPTPALAFIAFLVYKEVGSGDCLIHSPDWRLFLLPEHGVERFLLEAHRERLLDYQAAGRVIRLDFPAASVGGYAHALVERTGRTA